MAIITEAEYVIEQMRLSFLRYKDGVGEHVIQIKRSKAQNEWNYGYWKTKNGGEAGWDGERTTSDDDSEEESEEEIKIPSSPEHQTLAAVVGANELDRKGRGGGEMGGFRRDYMGKKYRKDVTKRVIQNLEIKIENDKDGSCATEDGARDKEPNKNETGKVDKMGLIDMLRVESKGRIGMIPKTRRREGSESDQSELELERIKNAGEMVINPAKVENAEILRRAQQSKEDEERRQRKKSHRGLNITGSRMARIWSIDKGVLNTIQETEYTVDGEGGPVEERVKDGADIQEKYSKGERLVDSLEENEDHKKFDGKVEDRIRKLVAPIKARRSKTYPAGNVVGNGPGSGAGAREEVDKKVAGSRIREEKNEDKRKTMYVQTSVEEKMLQKKQRPLSVYWEEPKQGTVAAIRPISILYEGRGRNEESKSQVRGGEGGRGRAKGGGREPGEYSGDAEGLEEEGEGEGEDGEEDELEDDDDDEKEKVLLEAKRKQQEKWMAASEQRQSRIDMIKRAGATQTSGLGQLLKGKGGRTTSVQIGVGYKQFIDQENGLSTIVYLPEILFNRQNERMEAAERAINVNLSETATAEQLIGAVLYLLSDRLNGLDSSNDTKEMGVIAVESSILEQYGRAECWDVRIAEIDGEIDYDFPVLDRTRVVSKIGITEFAICLAPTRQDKPQSAGIGADGYNAYPDYSGAAKPLNMYYRSRLANENTARLFKRQTATNERPETFLSAIRTSRILTNEDHGYDLAMNMPALRDSVQVDSTQKFTSSRIRDSVYRHNTHTYNYIAQNAGESAQLVRIYFYREQNEAKKNTGKHITRNSDVYLSTTIRTMVQDTLFDVLRLACRKWELVQRDYSLTFVEEPAKPLALARTVGELLPCNLEFCLVPNTLLSPQNEPNTNTNTKYNYDFNISSNSNNISSALSNLGRSDISSVSIDLLPSSVNCYSFQVFLCFAPAHVSKETYWATAQFIHLATLKRLGPLQTIPEKPKTTQTSSLPTYQQHKQPPQHWAIQCQCPRACQIDPDRNQVCGGLSEDNPTH
ncbi:hypothetical protein AX774_g809 [Zancudomyces culisetae]|uniref:CRIM domain-containing protein n=1 Tax=Zancudomyces culisetae TaxID=1213189 RepID=A0A1R1PXL8_ZANCU|nr:hypothetical protein AX774_g809 [Zancudomyces culisetae]|eukprot:OMH85638.1 hypothetical protein AX774_g809 [Zancudomyces culisetae]